MSEEKKTRRKKGSGSIIKLSNGTFRAELKYKDQYGNPQVLRDTFRTKSEAERTLKRYQKTVEQLKNAMTMDINKISVGEYFNEIYLPYKKKTSEADSTYKRYASTVNKHILPAHRDRILLQISNTDILGLLEQKKADGFSYSSVKKIHDAYNEMFNHAVARNDLLETENPMRLAPMISQKKFDEQEGPRVFIYEESEAFAVAAMHRYTTGNLVYRYGPVFMFLLNTGLRVGEICALTKEEVNLEKRTVSVNHTVSDRLFEVDGIEKYRKQIGPPKRPNSVRVVPLNDEAVKYAQMIFDTHTQSDTMFICTNKGEIVQPATLNKQMNSILNRAGIEDGGSPHTLRHTFVTILFDKDIDLHTIASIIGDDDATVKKTYLHIFQERKARAIELTNVTTGLK